MKKVNQSIAAGDNSTNWNVNGDLNISLNENIPSDLVNQVIQKELERLCKSRFYPEYDRVSSSLCLGRRLAEGDLSGGSEKIRGRGLAWCARLLSFSDKLERAEAFLEHAESLGDFPEAKIAKAFIVSQKQDKATALQVIAGIDSESSRSAALAIVAHHDGAEGAINWLNNAGYTFRELDSGGKCILLSHQLQLGYWDDASQTIRALSEIDFTETPILHQLTAVTTLASAVPAELREVLLTQVPFPANHFPLDSHAGAMEARRAAHTHFLEAVEVAKRLACPRAARTSDEFALWLELRDPTKAAHGKSRLKAKLRDPDSQLGFVHLALDFGVKLDLEAVEKKIDQKIVADGGMTIDTAIARFALAFTKSTPEEIANYIVRHQTQLAAHIDPKLIRFRQIEMLSRAGLIERANDVLGELLGQDLTPEEEKNLRRIIAAAEGHDPVELLKSQYRETGKLTDLINLLNELEEHQHWDDVCEYGKRLFEETHSLSDAERLVNAFNKTHRSESLVGFLKENVDLLSQSNYLQISYAWGLYHEGAFLESRAVLAELSDLVDSRYIRALQVNLGIATGDWGSLAAYIADEYQHRGERSANDLIGAAQLALHIGSPHAKELVIEAATKAYDDPAVLSAAYILATSAGWEDDQQVFHWLERAAQLSGDDGPLQKMSVKDVLERKPEWDRRESETWRLLAQGKIPIVLAAQSLNRTLVSLMTFPALANLTETDPRRRSAIPAYSGKRGPMNFDVAGKTVALEATALLTLSFLNVLDATLDVFETVYIPHSTLEWLFQERQKVTFHQPSRIANARKVRDLLATDLLKKFTPSTIPSSDLSVQVGDELAALIAEAEKIRDEDKTQHIVVRSAPVQRLSSLMQEEADLSAHAVVLSSCLAVVEKLRQKGQLTADEENRARTYLQLHEKPWPNQPEIADGATLYLDDLAISYLQHLGLLVKLKAASLTAVVSPRQASEADALISYESISEEVKDVIERIRAYLNIRLESGHVRAGARRNFDESETITIPEQTSFGILALASQCDLSIIDDRFINQHANIESGGTHAPIFSTLDLLNALVVAGVLSDDDCLEYRTRLRRAGYFFVPVNVEELERYLSESSVVEGKIVETAELKAIRESILRVRMSDWLQLPDEAPWLDGTLKAFARAIRNIWVDDVDLVEIIARSNWLVEQYDIRGWAHRLVPDVADNVVRVSRAANILLLLTPPESANESVIGAYWSWVGEKILDPVQEQFPEVYKWLIDFYRSQVTRIVEAQISERE